MSEQSRQLAAIMFTDIVGYTAEDEQKALELLKKNRKIQASSGTTNSSFPWLVAKFRDL